MQGRYGIDNFSRFLLAVAVACMLCSALLHAPALNSICWILLFCLYFRMFSKNIKKRCEEERMYMEAKDRLFRFCKGDKSIISDSKTHKIYRCPQCRQKIRVPRGKGKIEITCPTCRTKFNAPEHAAGKADQNRLPGLTCVWPEICRIAEWLLKFAGIMLVYRRKKYYT